MIDVMANITILTSPTILSVLVSPAPSSPDIPTLNDMMIIQVKIASLLSANTFIVLVHYVSNDDNFVIVFEKKFVQGVESAADKPTTRFLVEDISIFCYVSVILK